MRILITFTLGLGLALGAGAANSAQVVPAVPNQSSKPPKPPKAPTVDNSRQVYADATTKIYHSRQDCKDAAGGLTTMTQKQAVKAGYTQCKTCKTKKKT
jgi:hypothetical protein